MLTYSGHTQVAQALWAAGYRFFAPCDASLILHQWSRKRRPTFWVSIRQHTSAYVSIRQHTSAYVSIRQHTSAYVSIRQHTSAYVSIKKLKKQTFCSSNGRRHDCPTPRLRCSCAPGKKKKLKKKHSAAATADDTTAQLLGSVAPCAPA
jgi:hypothetical protein